MAMIDDLRRLLNTAKKRKAGYYSLSLEQVQDLLDYYDAAEAFLNFHRKQMATNPDEWDSVRDKVQAARKKLGDA